VPKTDTNRATRNELSTPQSAAARPGQRGEKAHRFACEIFHKRVIFRAVARDSKGMRERDDSPLNQGGFGSGPAGQFMGLGLQFVLALLLFLYVGKWVDGKLGTSPWFLILGVFTGSSAAFYSMYRRLKAEERREEAEDRQKKEGK